jgi:hypothetical protein
MQRTTHKLCSIPTLAVFVIVAVAVGGFLVGRQEVQNKSEVVTNVPVENKSCQALSGGVCDCDPCMCGPTCPTVEEFGPSVLEPAEEIGAAGPMGEPLGSSGLDTERSVPAEAKPNAEPERHFGLSVEAQTAIQTKEELIALRKMVAGMAAELSFLQYEVYGADMYRQMKSRRTTYPAWWARSTVEDFTRSTEAKSGNGVPKILFKE